MNLSSVGATELLEYMSLQLKKIFDTKNLKIDKDILLKLESWKRRKKEIRYHDSSRDGAIGGKIDLKFIKGEGKKSSLEGEKKEEVLEMEPDINELISLLNQMIKIISDKLEQELVIIIDDIDKLDLADSEELFFKHSRSLTTLNCKIIYTVPISLLYSVHYRQFESFYHSSHILPISKVKNKDNSENTPGIDKLKEIVTKRIAETRFEEGVLKEIIVSSGGVIRDVIKVVQLCCLICMTEEKDIIDTEIAAEAIYKVKNEFLRQIPKELYAKLIEVKNSPTKKPDTDQELQKLLYCLGALEYTNKDTWYDIHPLAMELAEEKEKEQEKKDKDKVVNGEKI